VVLLLVLPPTQLDFFILIAIRPHSPFGRRHTEMVGHPLPGLYDEVQALNYAGAAQTALFLLLVSYAVLLVVYAVNRNVWAAWPRK